MDSTGVALTTLEMSKVRAGVEKNRDRHNFKEALWDVFIKPKGSPYIDWHQAAVTSAALAVLLGSEAQMSGMQALVRCPTSLSERETRWTHVMKIIISVNECM
jgi:hypothetical protein